MTNAALPAGPASQPGRPSTIAHLLALSRPPCPVLLSRRAEVLAAATGTINSLLCMILPFSIWSFCFPFLSPSGPGSCWHQPPGARAGASCGIAPNHPKTLPLGQSQVGVWCHFYRPGMGAALNGAILRGRFSRTVCRVPWMRSTALWLLMLNRCGDQLQVLEALAFGQHRDSRRASGVHRHPVLLGQVRQRSGHDPHGAGEFPGSGPGRGGMRMRKPSGKPRGPAKSCSSRSS